MDKRFRLTIFAIFLIIFTVMGLKFEESIINLLNSFWFTSGLVFLLITSLIDQPFYTTYKNMFVNASSALIAILLSFNQKNGYLYYLLLFYAIYLLLTSYILYLVRSISLNKEGPILQLISTFNNVIGNPKVMFSIYFLWGISTQYKFDSFQFNSLLTFWFLYNILSNSKISRNIIYILDEILSNSKTSSNIFNLFGKKKLGNIEGIGKVFGVISKNTYLVNVHSKVKKIELFTLVKLKNSVDKKTYYGIITDIMLLDKEQWIKVYTSEEFNDLFKEKTFKNLKEDVVYLIEEQPDAGYINNFIGVVSEESNINKIRFLYNSKIRICEGDIIETKVQGKTILYQVIEGVTKLEKLSDKNRYGYIVGEAIQLGIWNKDLFKFDKFGWVPEINSPLHIATPVDEAKLSKDYIKVGHLPSTNYPIILNKNLSITHHMAVIGMTGTGKSVFARNIIRRYLEDQNVKVICVDFTGEYKQNFKDLAPVSIIEDIPDKKMENLIEAILHEESKFRHQRDKNIINKKWELFNILESAITKFLNNDYQRIALFELKDFYSSTNMMYLTMAFFRTLFLIAIKNHNYGKKISLVLEEAHTVIPEWMFNISNDKYAQSLVNIVGQIALQGRKYDIGLLVIAQRTANVSKTILTQCNTIISFRQYDDTSIEFLSNYFGNSLARNLPNLKQRQAIAAGLAFKSKIPLIFEVPDLYE